MRDRFDRPARKLRISVTDRCNFRCTYCMPAEGVPWFPRAEILTFEEIERLVRIAVGTGVEQVRLTGGEPTLRRDLPVLVRRLRALEGLRGLAITTNAYRLEAMAAELVEAGIDSFNVSLDSLREDRFAELTRLPGGLPRVLAGLEAAASSGARLPVKVNAVVMSGINEDEIEAFAELSRRGPYEVRFIEFMPLEGGHAWKRHKVVTGAQIRERIERRWPLVPLPRRDDAPATRYRFADRTDAHVGFIDSVTAPFCGHCDRIRITPDGQLMNCLFSTGDVDLKGPMRAGASDAELEAAMRGEVARKGPGGALDLTEFLRSGRARTMSQIGG